MKRKTLRSLYAPELLESRIAPATIIVTSLVDDGTDTIAEITLREAIGLANDQVTHPGSDTITFDPALLPVSVAGSSSLHATIVLTNEIEITDTLIIKGPGVDRLAISGDDLNRIFDIDDLDPLVLHPTTISGLSFEHGNTTTNGGAIRSTESLILKNTTFSNNYAGTAGGAIYVNTKGIINITSSAFLNNTADGGDSGAMYAQAEGNITIAKTLVSHNESTNGDVGGLRLHIPTGGAKPGHIIVDGVTFLSNSAGGGVGGGLWANNESLKGKITVKNSIFTGNSATTHGGGLYLLQGLTTVSGSTFSHNTAGTPTGGGAIVTIGDGGALFAAGGGSATLTIKSSRFDKNAATGRGGAIQVENSLLTSIAGSIFTGNSARAEGGAISAQGSGNFTIASSVLSGNSATGLGGGGIFAEDTTLVLKGSTLSGNSASNVGGGLRATIGSVLTISGGSFLGNSGNDGGGGIWTQGSGTDAVDLTVTGTLFSGNNSATGNGGGVAATGDGEVFIKSVKVRGNIAAASGGGMYLSSTSKITVTGSLFSQNHAEDNGGGLSLRGSGVTLVTGGSFLTNSAVSKGGGISIVGSAVVSVLKAKITGNIAGDAGGGLYGPIANPPVLTGSVITGNFASNGANIYLD